MQVVEINEGRLETSIPTVSVGMPVFNSEATIGKAIESILSQTYIDFELIISDNASTDNTESICMKYCAVDRRIRFVRQTKNIGAGNNFQYVLNQSRGTYFMWAAADDSRTPDFIEQNIYVLENNPACVFSSTANCFEGQETLLDKYNSFELKGNLYNRIVGFIDICWNSHGCFYALIKRSAVAEITYINERFLAADWVVIVSLLMQGEFCRANSGVQILGTNGSSMQPNYIKSMCKTPTEFVAPLIFFTKIVLRLCLKSDKLTKVEIIQIVGRLIKLNIKTAYMMYCEEINRSIKTALAK